MKQAKQPVATCDAQYALYEKLKKMFQCFPCVRQSLTLNLLAPTTVGARINP